MSDYARPATRDSLEAAHGRRRVAAQQTLADAHEKNGMMDPMKTCSKCGEAKPLSAFYFRKDQGKHRADCKACFSKKGKERYWSDPGKARARRAAYREGHRDELAAKQREYYQENREACLAQNKRYYEANKEHLLEWQRQYDKRNKERVIARKRAYYRKNRQRILAQMKEYAEQNREAIAAQKKAWRERRKERDREWRKAYRLANLERLREYDRKRQQLPSRREKSREYKRRWKQENRERYLKGAIACGHRRRARLYQAGGHFTVEQLQARIAFYGGRCWICGASYEAIDHVKPVSKGGSNWPSNLRPICTSCNSRKNDRWPIAAVQDAFDIAITHAPSFQGLCLP